MGSSAATRRLRILDSDGFNRRRVDRFSLASFRRWLRATATSSTTGRTSSGPGAGQQHTPGDYNLGRRFHHRRRLFANSSHGWDTSLDRLHKAAFSSRPLLLEPREPLQQLGYLHAVIEAWLLDPPRVPDRAMSGARRQLRVVWLLMYIHFSFQS